MLHLDKRAVVVAQRVVVIHDDLGVAWQSWMLHLDKREGHLKNTRQSE